VEAERTSIQRKELITAIKAVVFDAAIAGTEQLLVSPPGREPHAQLVELSRWYKGLEDPDRKRVIEVARMGVDGALFGLLCVLDGSRRAVKDVNHYRLEAVGANGQSFVLTDGGSLHEEYRNTIPPLGFDAI
jgi:hypothetical protein